MSLKNCASLRSTFVELLPRLCSHAANCAIDTRGRSAGLVVHLVVWDRVLPGGRGRLRNPRPRPARAATGRWDQGSAHPGCGPAQGASVTSTRMARANRAARRLLVRRRILVPVRWPPARGLADPACAISGGAPHGGRGNADALTKMHRASMAPRHVSYIHGQRAPRAPGREPGAPCLPARLLPPERAKQRRGAGASPARPAVYSTAGSPQPRERSRTPPRSLFSLPRRGGQFPSRAPWAGLRRDDSGHAPPRGVHRRAGGRFRAEHRAFPAPAAIAGRGAVAAPRRCRDGGDCLRATCACRRRAAW
jgi:hypothetical protein